MPNPFILDIKVPELPAVLAAFRNDAALRTSKINEALRDCDHVLTPAIKAETPIGKGARGEESHGGGRSLAASTSSRIVMSGDEQVLLISQNARTNRGVSYGPFVREGTKPHEISANAAKSLHFFVGGKEIFCQHVHHPGNKPNHYPERATEKVRSELDRIVAGINERTAQNIAAAGSK